MKKQALTIIKSLAESFEKESLTVAMVKAAQQELCDLGAVDGEPSEGILHIASALYMVSDDVEIIAGETDIGEGETVEGSKARTTWLLNEAIPKDIMKIV